MIDDKKMTRRSALKYMGASVAGVALASMGGLSCLTSCTENGKKNELSSILPLPGTACMLPDNSVKHR